jgi:hypothetical protein
LKKGRGDLLFENPPQPSFGKGGRVSPGPESIFPPLTKGDEGGFPNGKNYKLIKADKLVRN